MVLGVEDAGHEVDFCDDARLAVDIVGVGAGGSEGGFSFGEISDAVVDLALQKVQLHQKQFVVGLAHLNQNGLDDLHCAVGFANLEPESGQAKFHAVLEIGSFFGNAPLDKPLGQFDLQSLAAGHLGDIINKSFGNFGQPGL